ncbi:LuxR C-terminal-related transcriptional regulator [Streptomyces sp. NPDC012623]|uniref:helix-turn-helix transcriptional regulator n=1 Tax=unclassified Streptomyces TaxID=2593676 RepID=UPI0036831A3F
MTLPRPTHGPTHAGAPAPTGLAISRPAGARSRPADPAAPACATFPAEPGRSLRENLLHALGPREPESALALSALSDATLRELARTGLCSPASVRPPGGTTGWPGELAALTPEQTTAAGYCALLGPDVSPSLLAAVGGGDLGRALAVLDELAARRVVREDESGAPLFHFRHPLLRVLAYARIPPGRRIAAHAAAAHALARVGAPLPQRAPHLARSAAPGDTEAARLLHRAAHQVLDTRPDSAADWLLAALRVHPADAEGGAATLGTRILLCVAAARCGQRAEVVRRMPEVLASPLLPPDERGRLVDLYARMEDGLGRHREARALLATGTVVAGPTVVPAAPDTTLLLRSAALSAAAGDLAAVRERLAAVTTVTAASPGPAPGDAVRRMSAAATLALGAALASDVTARDAAVADATRRADLLTDAALPDVLDAVVRLGRAQHLTSRHRDAVRLFARGVRCARAGGRAAELPALLIGHARAEAVLGRLAAASVSAAEAAGAARRLDCPELAHEAGVIGGWTTLWSAGHDAAEPAARELARAGGPSGEQWRAAALLLAAVRLEAGRPQESLRLLLSPAADVSGPPGSGPAPWWSLACLAAAAAGLDGTARRCAAMARAAAGESRLPADHAAVLRAEAALVPDEAALPLLTSAVDQHVHDGALLLECRTRLLLARRLLGAGRLPEAAFHAGLAKSRAEPTGSEPLRQLAVGVQRAIGARRPRGTGSPGGAGPAGLSQRERQILGLVCRGMSNRDIAGALFVSVKTVEAHLTRVFRKTGTRSRAALVATFGAARPAGVRAPVESGAGARA